jgi:chromosome segregation ATPase
MRMLSRFFDRASAQPVTGTANSNQSPDSAAAEHSTSESWAEIGGKVGGDNESLRNLLTDVSRRIEALDDLREIFGAAVTPIGEALASLEREKFDNIKLRSLLEDINTRHQALRGEHAELRKQSAARQQEGNILRCDLAASQETAVALEAAKTDLTRELDVTLGKVVDLEQEVNRETAAARILTEHNQALTVHAEAADKRIIELEDMFGSTSEKLVLREDENRSLQNSLDRMVEQKSRLHRRIADHETTIETVSGQIVQLQTTLKDADGERARLTAAVAEANDRRQVETNALSTRLEATSSRASTAEKLLAEVRQSLQSRTEENATAERKAVEAAVARNFADKKLELANNALRAKERQLQETTQARTKLAERANKQLLDLRQRERALAQAEEQLQVLGTRIAQLEGDAEVSRRQSTDEIADLQSQLANERAGRTVAEGALKKARLTYAQLPSNLDDYARRGRSTKAKAGPRTRSAPRQRQQDLQMVAGPIHTAPEEADLVEQQDAASDAA